ARETSSKPYVGRIVSTFEWKTRRDAAADAASEGGVAWVRSITWPSCAASRLGCLCARVYQRSRIRRSSALRPVAVEREFETTRPPRVGEVIADPFDGGAIAGPDDLAVGVLDRQPEGVVVFVRQTRLRIDADTDRED